MEKKFKRKIKKTHRLFLCILPDKEIRDYARDVQRQIYRYSYKLNFVNLEQIHLTLKFLGNNVSDKSMELFIDTLNANMSNLSQFEISTREADFGYFTQSKPNVVYLALNDSMDLKKNIDVVHQIVRNLDLDDLIRKKDHTKFFSHITIARVRSDISKSTVKKIAEDVKKLPTRESKMIVKQISLIESILTKKGPVYKVIKHFAIQG